MNKSIKEEKYQAWTFGSDADELVNLVIKGEKTATASAYLLYEFENESLPKVGEYSVILDSKKQAVCIIRTTEVYVIPFRDVSKEHVYKEGDKTLSSWRKTHKEFFTQCLSSVGKLFNEDMQVVCEEFEVVYKSKLL